MDFSSPQFLMRPHICHHPQWLLWACYAQNGRGADAKLLTSAFGEPSAEILTPAPAYRWIRHVDSWL